MRSRGRHVVALGAFSVSVGLAACSGGGDASNGDQGCVSLGDAVDEARQAVELSTDLSTHADSDGGATVTSAESQEIQDHQQELDNARSALSAAGCT
jgi:hypothetical protein